MAIFHCSVKNISRGSGRTAVASSAYRSGEQMKDEELGKTYHYDKPEVAHTEIILCKNAPEEYQDRATLWNEVQKIEKSKDARLAREWEVAFPKELSLDQCKEIAHDYGQSLADEGMCVDIAIHWKEGNHHAHIMGTTRAIKENGEWAPKSKKVYDLDQNGERIYQKTDKNGRKIYKNHKEDYTDWNKTEKVEQWRERWAETCNRHLEQEHQIDHRSYERQGIEQIPTIHEGFQARQIEQNGGISEKCEANRAINEANQELAALSHEQKAIHSERSTLLKKLEELKEKINERLERFTERFNHRGTAHGAVGESRERTGFQRTGDTSALIREARAGISSATAKEQDSRTGRANRDAEQLRHNLEAKQRASEREPEAPRRKEKSRKISRGSGPEH